MALGVLVRLAFLSAFTFWGTARTVKEVVEQLGERVEMFHPSSFLELLSFPHPDLSGREVACWRQQGLVQRSPGVVLESPEPQLAQLDASPPAAGCLLLPQRNLCLAQQFTPTLSPGPVGCFAFLFIPELRKRLHGLGGYTPAATWPADAPGLR